MIKVIYAFRLGTYIATQFKLKCCKDNLSNDKCIKVLDTSCGWGDRLAGFFVQTQRIYWL